MIKGKLKCIALLLSCLLTYHCFSQPIIPFDQKYVDSITSRLSDLPDDTSKVNKLKILSAMYLLVKPALGIQYARQGKEIAEKINYPAGTINCLGQTAFFYAVTGEWAKATADVNEAMPLCEEYEPELLIYMYNIMYIVAATKDDTLEALMYAKKAQHHPAFSKFSEKQKWPTYMQLGRIYEALNNLDSAIYYSDILEDYVKKYGPTEPDLTSNSNTLLGSIAFRKKDYAKAIHYYQLASDYHRLAEVYGSMEQRDSVIHYGTLALKKSEIQKNFNLIQEAAKLLAKAFEKEDPVKANAYLNMYAAAKDSLYNNAKLKQLEAIKLNQQKNNFEMEKTAIASRNRLILFSLFAVLALLFIFLLMLWRNNRFKQHANTKLESAYENLKSTQAQLIQSEKMASLGELTAGIAHEIQNPLNFVNNFSEVNGELIKELRSEVIKGNFDEVSAIASDIESNSEKITHHGKRADVIVKGMLQHSQSSQGQKEPTDINRLADEYFKLCYSGMSLKDKSFKASLKTNFDESVGTINIIPQEIGRVLLNLYNNAFYAVNEKSKLNLPGYNPTVTVQTKKLNSRNQITVADNGNGIPQKIVDKIFQPFFTTKPTGQGTGLGLSLSYDIIKAHGGEIKVETKEGAGSTFIIQLPILIS